MSRLATRRVVVTGVGVVAPNGIGIEAFRAALRAGRSGVAWHEKLREYNFACQIGAIPPLSEEDVLKVLSYSTFHKLSENMVYAALAAIECARTSGESFDPQTYLESPVDWSTGAVIGCGVGGGIDVVIDEMGPILESAPRAEPGRGMLDLGSNAVARVMGSSVSATVGRLLGLGGQVTTNSSACTTGTEAIFEGWKHILLGYADSMYVGGAEASHHGIAAGFDAMRDVLCSTYNELPEKASQPMGAGACGFVPGSGAGVLRIEALESALRRGAPILCELVSAYCNAGGQRDGGSMTFPNPEGVTRCIQYVLRDANVHPSELSLINGHLTSTMADAQEVESWLHALDLPASSFPRIQSTKSMIGHGLGAAGAMEAVAVVDQLSQGYVHPSINCEDVHPRIRGIERSIVHELQEFPLEYVIKASFGFGDVNGCLLFKRWDGNAARRQR